MNYKCFKCGKGKGQISFLLNRSCEGCGWGEGKEFCSSCFEKHEQDYKTHKRTCNQREDKCDHCHQDIGKNYVEHSWGNLSEYRVKNKRTSQEYRVCPKCNACSYCRKARVQIMTNENDDKWKADVWLCKNCADNATPREADKKQRESRERVERDETSSMKCPRCQKKVLSLSRWDKRDDYSELVCENCYNQLDEQQGISGKNQPQRVVVHKSFTQKVYEFYQIPTFWWIAGIVGVIDLIYLYFYFFEREKLKESLKKNTLLKVFSYLLAIASVIILIIPVLFLLASAGGGRKRICQRCRRLEKNCRC